MDNAIDYSVDQYASKVIEKAIKFEGHDNLGRYLKAITSVSNESKLRPRVPLIDIASDQYGNVSSSSLSVRDDMITNHNPSI